MGISRRPIESKYAEKLDRYFGIKNCFSEYDPGNYVMTSQFSNIAQQISEFEVKKDDVWTISYPRTGSTWCQEMVWLIGNDLNFDYAKETLQSFRAPVLEISSFLIADHFKGFVDNYGNPVNFLPKYPSPRFIKSHLPVELLPVMMQQVKPKIVYITRNPKDVCVSYYHYCNHFFNMQCTFEEFCELFINGKVPVGSIWPHYIKYWNKRNEDNVLFLKYEDMKNDLKAVIQKTANFLDKSLTEEQVESLCDYLSFNKMKNNSSVNFQSVVENRVPKENLTDFIRRGQVGDWKNHMKPELSKKFDEWIQENAAGVQF